MEHENYGPFSCLVFFRGICFEVSNFVWLLWDATKEENWQVNALSFFLFHFRGQLFKYFLVCYRSWWWEGTPWLDIYELSYITHHKMRYIFPIQMLKYFKYFLRAVSSGWCFSFSSFFTGLDPVIVLCDRESTFSRQVGVI